MKKRTLCRILVLILALALTGCGGRTAAKTAVPKETAAPRETAAPTVPPTEPAQTEPTLPEDADLKLGKVEGNRYRNDYIGFACDLDDNWVVQGADALLGVPGEILDAMEGSELAELSKNYAQLMDMSAENGTALATMNVVYVKQDVASRLAYKMLTDEEIMDATLQQKDMMIEGYEAAGIHVTSLEKTPATFLGQETWGLMTIGEMDVGQEQTVPYYILQVFDYRKGSYGVTITVSSFLEDNTRELLDLFYPVN